ncbi:MAG: ABC transporter ATP-binding protein [Candidatus Micrarchaeaceae archaeon]|jgi:ABC-2 type transport system ATP-binding protein|nr:ABC transporter ATP-binding protein [Candidatus Micrarchaeota archaeon]HII09646.1 ABC transporter ATP-binding protein [Candidatus Micrarchaeota archaeon]
MHTLELKGVDSGYNGKSVLHGISFTAKESSVYVVLGPNGAGKTTLFRTIAGILEPLSGKIMLDGKEIDSSRKMRSSINYLSHYNALPEEMTVYNALRFYSDMEGGDPERVIELLDLKELRNKRISDLSQGQKKRVSIAKVFLVERDLYLLDEPTANLDPALSKEIRDLILRLSKNKLVLYSSHNLYEASDIGTNLILIKEGKLAMFDKIANVRSKSYRVGIRASGDISKIVDAKKGEGGYYVLTVSTPKEAGLALEKIVKSRILVTEMRELDNPLQELFGKDGK